MPDKGWERLGGRPRFESVSGGWVREDEPVFVQPKAMCARVFPDHIADEVGDEARGVSGKQADHLCLEAFLLEIIGGRYMRSQRFKEFVSLRPDPCQLVAITLEEIQGRPVGLGIDLDIHFCSHFQLL